MWHSVQGDKMGSGHRSDLMILAVFFKLNDAVILSPICATGPLQPAPGIWLCQELWAASQLGGIWLVYQSR